MNAPDKIYIHTRTEPYCSITWSEVPEKNCTNEEYIRKDALLDWLKECKENPVITDLQKGNIQEMIEKIESL